MTFNLTRTRFISWAVPAVAAVAAIAAVAAVGASSYVASSPAAPCFVAGATAYRMSTAAAASYIVRIDNSAPAPDLRLQLVDDPAAADFVLVDEGDAGHACTAATAIRSVRVDPQAREADLTVALSRDPAARKIYVRSAAFSEQDAAALFAAIWQDSRRAGVHRQLAQRR
jgi:hypothetical protein